MIETQVVATVCCAICGTPLAMGEGETEEMNGRGEFQEKSKIRCYFLPCYKCNADIDALISTMKEYTDRMSRVKNAINEKKNTKKEEEATG